MTSDDKSSAPSEAPSGDKETQDSETQDKDRVIDITLDERTIGQRSAAVERERACAVYDLIAQNVFRPISKRTDGAAWSGPFRLRLSVEDSRLVFQITGEGGEEQGRILLSLAPFRRIVRDYFQICESYFDAVKKLSPSAIEAIDMARRGLHDEGASLLCEHLTDKIETDHASARRLFTLIAMLYLRL